MLLPLDLAALAWKLGHISPELALGWRLGRHAHDFFCGLDGVRIAATGHDHTLAGAGVAGGARRPLPHAIGINREQRPITGERR
jgi:hypothetical protein